MRFVMFDCTKEYSIVANNQQPISISKKVNAFNGWICIFTILQTPYIKYSPKSILQIFLKTKDKRN